MDTGTRRSLRFVLGLVTFLAIVYGGWRIFRVLQEGPDQDRSAFTILLKDAGGLRPGAALRLRGMEVGEVRSLGLDLEAGRVRVEVTVPTKLEKLFSSTTQCWVVKPRFGGLAGELSGLDTLIKDGYLRVRTRPGGRPLGVGGEIFGLEAPPEDLAEGEIEDAHPGDLLGRVLLPDAHGLSVGSPIYLRGIEVGEVRRMRLSEKGEGVLISIRVGAAFRKTVRERSRFWVARPTVHGNLLTGITADKLGSLLQPALAYDQGEIESGPATDGAFFVGLALPSSVQEDWPGRLGDMEAIESRPLERDKSKRRISTTVTVRYTAIEKDTFSNDDIRAEGKGLLFRRGGRFFVLIARSACDGTFILSDGFWDSLEVSDEKLRVHLEDARVWPARRIWVAPDDHDLALLECSPPENASHALLPLWSSYLSFGGSDVAAPDPTSAAGLEIGHIFASDGRSHGLWGQARAGSDTGPRLASFKLLPEALRPDKR